MDADGPWDDIPTAGDLAANRWLKVNVISPSASAFEGTATAVVAPAHDGQVGILHGHAPMVVLLGTGKLRVSSVDGETSLHVSRGFLQVVDDEVTVLAEEVEIL